MNVLKKLASGLALLTMVATTLPMASASGFELYTQDTIAGYDTVLRSSQVEPLEEVHATILKPNGSLIELKTTAGESGFATIDVNGFHTSQSGLYHVNGYAFGTANDIVETYFEVFADQPSMMTSSVKASKNSAKADGKDAVEITVTLKDAYQNPIKHHEIQLISSRSSDTITAQGSTMTNEQGVVVFSVAGQEDGVSTITAIDTTTGDILTKRESVMFSGTVVTSERRSPRSSILGSSLLAQAQNVPQDAASLMVSTNPAGKVNVREAFDITVTARTQQNQPAIDYRGSIEVSSDDASATLPTQIRPYTFTGAEQPLGSITFSLAGSFTTPGTKTITVRDIDNPNLTDELVLQVIDPSGPAIEDTEILITEPQPGVITTKDVIVSGTTNPGILLKIFDNGLEVAEARSNNVGQFETELTNLTDGSHEVVVRWVDANGATLAESDPVQFTLRTSGPSLRGLNYIPQKDSYKPLEKVRVEVQSEAGLTSSNYSINGILTNLTENASTPGVYEGEVLMPADSGTYDVNILLTNTLGLTENVEIADAITIKSATLDLSTIAYELVDDTSVQVTWTNPEDTSGFAFYNVKFGLTADNLAGEQRVATTEEAITFRDLDLGTTYYFQFEVLDSQGTVLSSDEVRSVTTTEAISITDAKVESTETGLKLTWKASGPENAIASYRILYGISSENYLRDVTVDKSKLDIEIEELVPGSMHYFAIQAKNAEGDTILQSDEVSGQREVKPAATEDICIPGDVTGLRVEMRNGQKYLVWNPANRAEGYVVYSGVAEGNYNLPKQNVATTELNISSLSDEVPHYYFSVAATCGAQESARLSQALKVQTGAIAMLLFFAAFGLAGYGTFLRMKKQLQ